MLLRNKLECLSLADNGAADFEKGNNCWNTKNTFYLGDIWLSNFNPNLEAVHLINT
jgi:hypothetical protein